MIISKLTVGPELGSDTRSEATLLARGEGSGEWGKRSGFSPGWSVADFRNRVPVEKKRSYLKIKVSSYNSFVGMSRTGASGHIILGRMSRTGAFGRIILVRMSGAGALGAIILVRMCCTGALGRIVLAKMCRIGGVRAHFIVHIHGFVFQSADYIAILDGSKLPSGK